MRVERVVLEHHRDIAVLRLDPVDDPPVDRHRPRRDLLEPRDHAQQGRFAAARRSDDHHQLTIRHGAADAVDDLALAVGFLDVVEGQRSHLSLVRNAEARGRDRPGAGERHATGFPSRVRMMVSPALARATSASNASSGLATEISKVLANRIALPPAPGGNAARQRGCSVSRKPSLSSRSATRVRLRVLDGGGDRRTSAPPPCRSARRAPRRRRSAGRASRSRPNAGRSGRCRPAQSRRPCRRLARPMTARSRASCGSRRRAPPPAPVSRPRAGCRRRSPAAESWISAASSTAAGRRVGTLISRCRPGL